ncbi:MAG: hypothetical protein FJ145_09295, partial [Deltaproteobacteria bacterium]|nr:hypothetical protein [Deltaproteobacteria bacterium]
ERYLHATYARDFKNAYAHIAAQDQRLKDQRTFVRERGSFAGFALETARRLAVYMETSLLEHRIVGQRAYVKMAVKTPDPAKLAPLIYEWDEERLERLTAVERKALLAKLETLHRERQIEWAESLENFELIKEARGWKVLLNLAAGKEVTFQTTIPPTLALEAQVKRASVVTRTGDNFTISLRIRNNSKQEVVTRIGHLVDPFEFRDYLDLIECGFLYPVKLPPEKETEFTATYRVREALPDSVRKLSVTYAIAPMR